MVSARTQPHGEGLSDPADRGAPAHQGLHRGSVRRAEQGLMLQLLEVRMLQAAPAQMEAAL